MRCNRGANRYVGTWQGECDTFGRPTVIVLLFKCEWNMAVNTCLDSNSCSPRRLDREMNRWTADGASANHRARLRRHPTPDWSVAARAPALNDSLQRWRSFSLFTVSVVYHTRSGYPPWSTSGFSGKRWVVLAVCTIFLDRRIICVRLRGSCLSPDTSQHHR